MFVRTGQPGLWFIAGSFAQCRIYSKYLGLQIKACEAGLLPRPARFRTPRARAARFEPNRIARESKCRPCPWASAVGREDKVMKSMWLSGLASAVF